MRRLNKKASAVDLFFVAIALVFLSVSILIGTKIATKFHEGISENPTFQNDAPNAIAYTNDAINNYTFSVNSGFLFLTVFFVIATLTLAALVRIHPIFIPIFIIALMESTGSMYGMMHNIMVGLPFIVGVLGIILMIVMYKNYQIG